MLRAYFNLFSKPTAFANSIVQTFKDYSGAGTARAAGSPEYDAKGRRLFVRSHDQDGVREIWECPDGVKEQTLDGVPEQFQTNNRHWWKADSAAAKAWFAEGVAAQDRKPIFVERNESPHGPDPDTGCLLVSETWLHPEFGEQSVWVTVHPDGTEARFDPDWLKSFKGEGLCDAGLASDAKVVAYRAELAERGAAGLAQLRRERLISAIEMGHLLRYAPDVDTSGGHGPELFFEVVFVNGQSTARSPSKPGADGVIERFGIEDLQALAKDTTLSARVKGDLDRAREELDPGEEVPGALVLQPGM